MSTTVTTQPHPKGGWGVRLGSSPRWAHIASVKDQAVAAGRREARRVRGVHVVLRKDGSVEFSYDHVRG